MENEAGRYGLLTVMLSYRINKSRESRDVLAENVLMYGHERHGVRALWQRGVRVQDNYVLSYAQHAHLSYDRLSAPASSPHKL